MQITTIYGINLTNYDQPEFYYVLTSNNNAITVTVQPLGVLIGNNYVEVTLDGNRWFKYGDISIQSPIIINSLIGIVAVRINVDPLFEYNFIMQISEYATPVRYMAVG